MSSRAGVFVPPLSLPARRGLRHSGVQAGGAGLRSRGKLAAIRLLEAQRDEIDDALEEAEDRLLAAIDALPGGKDTA